MRKLTESQVRHAATQFLPEEEIRNIEGFGSGHINDTYRVEGAREYVLQRLNTDVFRDPVLVMDNICKITEFLRDKILAQGGNPDRETMTVVRCKNDNRYFIDREDNFFRMYLMITDAKTYDAAETAKDFRNSAVAFGHFQYLLNDFPVDTLHEVIPRFHDTSKRFHDFKNALNEDPLGRAAMCRKEVEFLLDREADCNITRDTSENGNLPLRVTHNDTKLNNVMIDNSSRKGICIIDLDTVMPGLSIYDFGDSIRFGANTAMEDERDVSRVSLSLELYRTYLEGFLEGCGGILTRDEVRMLPWGARLMTLECALRFLEDYLNGDVYFHTEYQEHNLVRARVQIALLRDMEYKWHQMIEVTEKYCG